MQDESDAPEQLSYKCAKLLNGIPNASTGKGTIKSTANEQTLEVQSSESVEIDDGSESDDEGSETPGSSGEVESASESEEAEDGCSDEDTGDDSESSDVFDGSEEIEDMEINTSGELLREKSSGAQSAAELGAEWGHLKGVRIVNDLESDGAAMAQVHGLLRTQRYHDDDMSQPFKVPMTITR